jgi:hypothetical protein
LGNNTGTPQHLASGFIYGIPDQPNQIPDHFYTGIGFNYARAGGAQVAAPGRGWIWGLSEYKVCTVDLQFTPLAYSEIGSIRICAFKLQDSQEVQRQFHFPNP